MSCKDTDMEMDRKVSLQDGINMVDNCQIEDNCSSNGCSNIETNNPTVTPSKRELKRQKKFERRLKMRAEWKLQRKLKNKERKSRQKESSLHVQKRKITPMASSSNKLGVVIDFSYDELMSIKDLIKCGSQVVRCYSSNRRSINPVQLHFCHFTGKIQQEMSKCYEFDKWNINFHEVSYLEVFKKEDLVYLTSESRNVLETLDQSKVYIIGGLVDHNAHKGVSYRKAVLEGIDHAQLPIKKHIQMKSRSVLTINHVFEILLRVSNGESWPQALLGVIPPRYFENGNLQKSLPCDTNTSNDTDNVSEDIAENPPVVSTPDAGTEVSTE